MIKPFFSAILAILVAAPTTVTAVSIAPIQVTTSSPTRAGTTATSSAPARAVASSSAAPLKAIEPDEIDVMADPQEGIEPDEIDVMQDPEEASFDAYIKIPDIEGESDPQPLMPDFGILLGGENTEDDDEETLTPVEELILNGLQGEGAPAETLSLNYEKIKTKVRQEVKLFGFIPVETTAMVDVDADGDVEVAFPWWAFLASGKDSEALGQKIFNSLSNVLKSKHDALMSTIQNTR